MFDDLYELYQEVILDHSRHPRNFHELQQPDAKAEGSNPLCGDSLVVYFHMEGDRIRNVSFQGSGCAISKASASIMTGALKGKSKAEARRLFERFHKLVTKGADTEEEMGKLMAFAGVHKFPARVKCATLPWHAMEAALDGKPAVVSTEINE